MGEKSLEKMISAIEEEVQKVNSIFQKASNLSDQIIEEVDQLIIDMQPLIIEDEETRIKVFDYYRSFINSNKNISIKYELAKDKIKTLMVIAEERIAGDTISLFKRRAGLGLKDPEDGISYESGHYHFNPIYQGHFPPFKEKYIESADKEVYSLVETCKKVAREIESSPIHIVAGRIIPHTRKIIVSATKVNKLNMGPDDVLVIDKKVKNNYYYYGNKDKSPTSETPTIWKALNTLYKEEKHQCVFLHAHTLNLLKKCAHCGRNLGGSVGEDRVPIEPWHEFGLEEFGEILVENFKLGYNCVILQNHGPYIIAKDWNLAFNILKDCENRASRLIQD
ncbi:MAG: class II aldolase/adducin family protein [Candidatus Thermoplasmatota archaeon]|nr:class II aldolase/adducin family protein [Candidatus Thermoplasmatota archaeon]